MPTPLAPPATSPDAADDAAIDSLPNAHDPEPATAAPPASAPAAPKPPEAKAPEPPAKPEPAPAAKPEHDDIDDLPTEPKTVPAAGKPAAAAPSAEPKTPKELRAAYEARGQEAAALKAEAAELRKQIDLARKAGAEEAVKTLREELAGVTKERTELADKIRFLNYRESGEYAEKFQKPLEAAWKEALTDIQGMTFEADDGTTHNVTDAHLTWLLQMPAGQAAAQASKLFGVAAPEILAHRRAIIGLQKASQAALDEWKAKGSEISAAQERQQAESQQARVAAFAKGIVDARETMPDVFGRPTDPEAAAYFDKGEKLVALAFRGEGLPSGLTPDQRTARIVSAQASLAARAASFGPTRHALLKANARVKELEAEVATYKESEPAPATTKTPAPAASDDDFEAAIDRLPNA